MKNFLIITGLVLTLASGVMALANEEESGQDSVSFLQEKGVILGYEDGDLKLDNGINRAELVKAIVIAKGVDPKGRDCFTDVTREWFAPYICAAKEAKLIRGREDGSFDPAGPVRLVEALKIMAEAFDIKLVEPRGLDWFSPYLETMAALNYIPSTLDYYAESLTRGEAFELLWRVMEDIRDKESTQLDEFKGNDCTVYEPESYDGIDMEKVKNTWLSWTNEARANQGLGAYGWSGDLDRTATIWSEASRAKGYMDHKRSGQTAYYDYDRIENWFADQGVTFENWGGITFTENIGHGPYSCSDDECTDELIRAIRYTFDYFMSEAGQAYRPHYNSIMNSKFQKIGFGLVLTDSQYYFTVHYGTAVGSDAALCD